MDLVLLHPKYIFVLYYSLHIERHGQNLHRQTPSRQRNQNGVDYKFETDDNIRHLYSVAVTQLLRHLTVTGSSPGTCFRGLWNTLYQIRSIDINDIKLCPYSTTTHFTLPYATSEEASSNSLKQSRRSPLFLYFEFSLSKYTRQMAFQFKHLSTTMQLDP